jgi:hypothetical protein
MFSRRIFASISPPQTVNRGGTIKHPHKALHAGALFRFLLETGSEQKWQQYARHTKSGALLLAVTGLLLGIGVVGFRPRHLPLRLFLVIQKGIPSEMEGAAHQIFVRDHATTVAAIRPLDCLRADSR